MSTRIYAVTALSTGVAALVRAHNQAQAIRHVARAEYKAAVAGQDELVALLTAGVKVQDAGEEVEAPDPDATLIPPMPDPVPVIYEPREDVLLTADVFVPDVDDGHDGSDRSFAPGERVIYVPMHAHGNRAHPDCEHGKVSSVNDAGTVFVRFDASVARLGWDGATAQACYADSLVHE